MATHSSSLAWGIPTNRGAWRATAHRVTESRTRLSTHVCTLEVLQLRNDIQTSSYLSVFEHPMDVKFLTFSCTWDSCIDKVRIDFSH